MYQKVKSSVILKKIFNIIGYKTKLQTIAYNKNLQRKIDLNIIDYKRFSGRYKIIHYGIINEYSCYNDKLLFEGEYLNGRRSGKGREYDEEGNIIFEGEYLNGKKWKGIQKEYDKDNDKLTYEFEISNGEREGIIKEYDKYTGEILFIGKYSNGKRNGKGIEYKCIPCESYKNISSGNNYKLITIFSGEYLNGERTQGKEFNCEEKLIYEGEYLNGKRNGKVKYLMVIMI